MSHTIALRPTPPQTRGDRRNYPMNCWWVAARGDEVGRTPLGRWYLDRPVVLYRTEAGRVVALDDRCMHRSAPLSTGFLEGDELVCGYHGARFAPDGRCSRFPTQPTVPPAACVRSYPVQELGPLIWIWLGDAALADAAEPPPALAWATDPGWTVVHGEVTLDANYLLFHENVLDLTHFNTLHRNSFGITRWVPAQFSLQGDQVRSVQSFDGSTLSVEERFQLRMDEATVSMTVDAKMYSPAWNAAHTVKLREPHPDLAPREENWIAHFVTPQSASKTHYWWIFGVDWKMPDDMAQGFQGLISTGFNEDKVMLGAIQALQDADPRGTACPEVSFVGDTGGIMARRVVQGMLASERSKAA